MNPDRWSVELDQLTQNFKNEFGALSEIQLNWKPNPQPWSIAQNIQHLIAVNESYYPVLTSVKNNTYQPPWLGRFGFVTKFLGKTVLDAVQPDRRKKMKTFPIWEPGASNLTDSMVRFEKHHHELKQQMKGSLDLIKRGVVISSPANKMIVYKLETAFDIMVAHEKRHLEQAKEMNQLRIKST